MNRDLIEKHVASLEIRNRVLQEDYDALRLKYMVIKDDYRHSQKANNKYKRRIKNLRENNERLNNILNQNGGTEEKFFAAKPRGVLPG